MRWTTHLATGMLAATLIGQPPAGIAVAGVFSLLPDLDTPESKLGRKLPFISLPLNLIFGHRGMLHSLLAVIIAYIAAIQFFPTWAIPMTIGYASHLILDSLTPSKIPWLWPYPEYYGFPLVMTNSLTDITLSVLMTLFLAASWSQIIF